MHMGSLATIGRLAPKNYIHIMINNGAHESVGGQNTGAFLVDWSAVARACGYKSTFIAKDLNELQNVTKQIVNSEGPVFFEIRTSQGSRKELGRPKSTPIENKEQFMKALI
jgi:phosphonopyruvate decarboxylase